MGNFSPVTLHMGKFTSVTEVTDKSPENRAGVLPRSSMIVKNSPSVDRAHVNSLLGVEGRAVRRLHSVIGEASKIMQICYSTHLGSPRFKAAFYIFEGGKGYFRDP